MLSLEIRKLLKSNRIIDLRLAIILLADEVEELKERIENLGDVESE